MTSIDQRVVHMHFDNAQFEHGIRTTLASLEALNKSLKLEGATKGLHELGAAGKSVQLNHIGAAVDGIANKFRAMSVVAITALSTIAHQALSSGGQIIKSLTIDPVRTGLREYETQLNSIQTILSNTQWQNTGLEDVNKALRILNAYSDQTIYNFGQMARNIGTFTAAGVKLDVATNAIKGIANLAAISGSNAEQASSAMYQLSQALATGTLKLIDWNSVVNAGMGGKVFQDALMETARVHGVAIDKMVKDAGGFRGSLEKGWLSSEILTETLSKFTGDLTAQQLKSMGYNQQQIAGILKMGKVAQDAATKVKTVSQLIGTLQEAAGSGWAQTWEIIFGDFEEAKSLFTDVNNVLGGFIQSSAKTRNAVLGDWKELGGRTVLIEGISLAFNNLMEILNPIRLAFRDIFPKATGKQLYELTVAFRNLMSELRLGEDTMTNLRRTFAGVFAIFGIAWDIVKRLGTVLFELFRETGIGAGNFLEVTANIGDFLVNLRRAINEGEGLTNFFRGLKAVLKVPLQLLSMFAKLIASMFDGFDAAGAADDVVQFVENFGPLGMLANFVVNVWKKVLSVFDDIWTQLAPLASKFSEWFHEIQEAIGVLDFDRLLKLINTGIFASLVLVIRNSLGKGGISGSIEQLTSTLGTMQTTLRATTLLQIAAAVGILAASVLILSTIDSAGLTRALSALAVMFAQLMGALALLQLMPGNNVFKLYAMAASLIVLGAAVGVLAISVKSLSSLGWDELIRGLTGVVVLLGAMVGAAHALPDGARLISTGLGLLVLAAGIKVLASAVTDLSGLSWEEMAKGLISVGALLGALALFTKFAQANALGVLSGAGIILLAVGIKILASAMHDFKGLSWEDIGKGLTTIAGGLTLMAAALILIPPTSIFSAAAVLVVATSLGMIADAVRKMGGLKWGEIGKGLTTLAGALVLISAALIVIPPTSIFSAGAVLVVALAIEILAEALKKMSGMSWEEIAKGLVTLAGSLAIITATLILLPSAVPGAIALLIISGALTILSGVLLILGNMSWGEIVKGLVALAGVFLVIGAAGLILAPIIPVLLGLGLAITLIGVGLAAAGAGVFLFATGLTALSVAGAAGAAAIVAIAAAVIGLIPLLIEQLGVALLLLIKIVAEATPEIVALILDILVQILEGIARLAPVLTVALLKLIDMLLTVLVQAVPKMVQAGYKILIGILEGIRDNITKVVVVAGQVIENFIRGIGKSLPGIIQAGVDLILAFIRGLTKAIENNSAAMGEAGAELGLAIVKGIARGLLSAGGVVSEAARNVAKNALNSAKNFLGISSPAKKAIPLGEQFDRGMALGLDKFSKVVESSAEDVGKDAIKTLSVSLSQLQDMMKAEVDLNPTITPVLDLTNVKRNAGEVATMLSAKPIMIDTTLSSANKASDGINDNRPTPPDDPENVVAGTQINYIQNNTSPKALSTAEIYRQTKNQLSTTKGGLPT